MIMAGGAGQLAVGDLHDDDLYQAAGRQHASWEVEDDDRVIRLYETTLTILRKHL